MRGRIFGLVLLALGVGVLISAILPAGIPVFIIGIAAVCAGVLSYRRC